MIKGYVYMVLTALIIIWIIVSEVRFTKEDAPLSAYQCFKRRESTLSEIDYIGVKKALTYLGLFDGQNEVELKNVKSHGTFI